MFTKPVYNLPPQYNEATLSQNFANLHVNPSQQQTTDFLQFHRAPEQQQQQLSYDIGGYAPPSLNETNTQWPSPDDTNVSYQRGSTAVRQYNNSNIDDYYKKFIRPITDYVPVSTNGQPTYVYQNLGGDKTASTQPVISGGK